MCWCGAPWRAAARSPSSLRPWQAPAVDCRCCRVPHAVAAVACCRPRACRYCCRHLFVPPPAARLPHLPQQPRPTAVCVRHDCSLLQDLLARDASGAIVKFSGVPPADAVPHARLCFEAGCGGLSSSCLHAALGLLLQSAAPPPRGAPLVLRPLTLLPPPPPALPRGLPRLLLQRRGRRRRGSGGGATEAWRMICPWRGCGVWGLWCVVLRYGDCGMWGLPCRGCGLCAARAWAAQEGRKALPSRSTYPNAVAAAPASLAMREGQRAVWSKLPAIQVPLLCTTRACYSRL